MPLAGRCNVAESRTWSKWNANLLRSRTCFSVLTVVGRECYYSKTDFSFRPAPHGAARHTVLAGRPSTTPGHLGVDTFEYRESYAYVYVNICISCSALGSVVCFQAVNAYSGQLAVGITYMKAFLHSAGHTIMVNGFGVQTQLTYF